MATQYSGRTSAHCHKFGDWESKDISDVDPAITQTVLFNAQWTDCPVEVEAEVKVLWKWKEFGNDNFYFNWDRDKEYWYSPSFEPFGEKRSYECEDDEDDAKDAPLSEIFPIIDEYLMSKGVEKCLIHWWW